MPSNKLGLARQFINQFQARLPLNDKFMNTSYTMLRWKQASPPRHWQRDVDLGAAAATTTCVSMIYDGIVSCHPLRKLCSFPLIVDFHF